MRSKYALLLIQSKQGMSQHIRKDQIFTFILQKHAGIRQSSQGLGLFCKGENPQAVHSVRERTNLGPTGLDQFSLTE